MTCHSAIEATYSTQQYERLAKQLQRVTLLNNRDPTDIEMLNNHQIGSRDEPLSIA